MSREKRIEQWLNTAGINNNARPGGVGLAALETISRWLTTRADAPTVSMAWVTPENIHLFFAENTALAAPWRKGADEREWIVTPRAALQLPAGTSFAPQMSALTGIGDTPDGCKVFYNLTRLQRVGAHGTSELCNGFIIGMVMEMAGQAWTADHDIWLVGQGELGDKMINFLAPFHRNMFAADKITDIPAAALAGRSATLFVMGSTADDLLAFDQVAAAGTSLVTDTVLGNEVTLAVEIQTDTTARVLPLDYELFPVLVTPDDEVYLAMDAQWIARENLLEELRTTDFTVNDIINAPAAAAGTMPTAQRDIAAWCRQLTGYEQAETIRRVSEAVASQSQELSDGEREQLSAALQIALARAVADADIDTAQSILEAQNTLNEGGPL
ncbi:hypothetical protein [Arthrobacter sp. MAHUQ-56]